MALLDQQTGGRTVQIRRRLDFPNDFEDVFDFVDFAPMEVGFISDDDDEEEGAHEARLEARGPNGFIGFIRNDGWVEGRLFAVHRTLLMGYFAVHLAGGMTLWGPGPAHVQLALAVLDDDSSEDSDTDPDLTMMARSDSSDSDYDGNVYWSMALVAPASYFDSDDSESDLDLTMNSGLRL